MHGGKALATFALLQRLSHTEFRIPHHYADISLRNHKKPHPQAVVDESQVAVDHLKMKS
ncbi:hypothetical protein D3C74_494280 [compost metagenome]